MERRRVLFLCTGNSARSQMAEGLVNHFLGERWEAASAGTHPAGYVHPLAVRAMAELGIDISAHRSKSVEEFYSAAGGERFDVVITVCDGAAQNCPLWLGSGRKLHLGFPDPAAVVGSEDEGLEAFRRVRDGLREQVFAVLEQAEKSAGDGARGVTFYATRTL